MVVRGLLDPKVDFVFKTIFGAEENSKLLISFLNAVLKNDYPITKIEVKNKDLEKSFLEDRYSNLDVKAKTSDGEFINIQIQIKSQYNTIKRTLYYLSKSYEEQLEEGEDFSNLNRTVCINILNFRYLENDRFHNRYRLKEVDTDQELTKVQEIHFIEIPKLDRKYDERDLLVSWAKFLRNPQSKDVKKMELTIKDIKAAKEELIKISSDKKQRQLYEMRANILSDKVSALNEAQKNGLEKGREEGIKEGKMEVAKNLININLGNKEISILTKLNIEEIEKLRKGKKNKK